MGYPFAEKYEAPGFIVLNSNINPFGPSPSALESILKNAHRANFYPSQEDYFEFKKLIALKLKDEGITVKPESIVLGNGSDEVIDFVLRLALLRFGKPKVIVGRNTFAFYEYCALSYGLEVLKVPLKDFEYDIDLMLDTIKKNTPCVVFICNPINPTGKIIPKSLFESFVNSLPDDVFVVSDEAYFEFSYFLNGKDWRGNDYASAMHLNIRKPEIVFVTRTFSKVYGLAGLRLGYLVSHFSKYIDENIRPPFNVNYLALEAGKGALLDKAFVQKTLENNLEGIRVLERIENTVPSWANFVLIKLKKSTTYDELKRNKILVRDMRPYGFEGYIRVSIGKLKDMEIFFEIFRKIEN